MRIPFPTRRPASAPLVATWILACLLALPGLRAQLLDGPPPCPFLGGGLADVDAPRPASAWESVLSDPLLPHLLEAAQRAMKAPVDGKLDPGLGLRDLVRDAIRPESVDRNGRTRAATEPLNFAYGPVLAEHEAPLPAGFAGGRQEHPEIGRALLSGLAGADPADGDEFAAYGWDLPRSRMGDDSGRLESILSDR